MSTAQLAFVVGCSVRLGRGRYEAMSEMRNWLADKSMGLQRWPARYRDGTY